jgi:cyclopropane-fatty-acyl-phospholipid synthase
MTTALGAGIAARLASLVPGGVLPVRLRAWDGSVAGPADGPELVIRDPKALRRLLWSPNELGLAQAYIAGEVDVDGDLADGLRQVWRYARARNGVRGGVRVGTAERLRTLLTAVRLGVFGPKPAPPDVQARLDGPAHTRSRDSAAISHHYDLPNGFYRLILDRRMTYSCAYWKSDLPGDDLDRAQFDKRELICRKLGLEPGMRMLDVGCGWGALAVHAARHHGVTVTGVTLSARQRSYAVEQVAAAGLAGAIEIRLQDYRDVVDGPYDAIATVEMGEHVGADRYPAFAARLHYLLAPRARLLVQQISRRRVPGGGAFVASYVAPDLHMRPVGETVALLEGAGLEVRDVQVLREHYVRTLQCWSDGLARHWDEAVALVGEQTARVWRLYLAGAVVTFEQGRMGVDQILAVRPAGDGASGMPAIRS